MLTARIDGGGDGPPALAFCLVPGAELQVIDTWHVAGLRGTGSKDVAVDGVFVPEHRALSARSAHAGESPGLALHVAPLDRNLFTGMLVVALVAPTIGAAEEAAAAQAARLIVERVCDDLMAVGIAGGAVSPVQRTGYSRERLRGAIGVPRGRCGHGRERRRRPLPGQRRSALLARCARRRSPRGAQLAGAGRCLRASVDRTDSSQATRGRVR
jgi:hypothetical protein